MKIPLTLGYDSQARKDTPLLATVFGYFAAAMAGLSRHCVRSNDKHNPGEPVHWARGKSMDHAECSLRHLIDCEDIRAWLRRNPEHPEREAVLVMLEHELDARVWRASAESQQFYEEFRGAPLSFSSRPPEFVLPFKPGAVNTPGEAAELERIRGTVKLVAVPTVPEGTLPSAEEFLDDGTDDDFPELFTELNADDADEETVAAPEEPLERCGKMHGPSGHVCAHDAGHPGKHANGLRVWD